MSHGTENKNQNYYILAKEKDNQGSCHEFGTREDKTYR